MQSTFREMIADNRRKSVMLVLFFCLFVVVVAIVLGLAIMAYMAPEALRDLNWQRSLMIGGVAALISFALSFFAYYAGANFILAVSGAKQIRHADDPELFNVVEEMSIAAGVPMPKVYIMVDSAPNAFATGRDPKSGIVCVTTGLRQKLNREELQGVIAHELGHIRNYDIRLMLLMAVLIGTVVMLADFFLRIMWYMPSGGGKRSRDKKGGEGILILVIIVFAIILSIIAPILAQIIQLAVSRQREYLADASAVEFTRNPLGLASALRKIDGDHDVLEAANRGTAHLFIANPIKKFEARANSMFASHPPIQERIRRLEALAE